jgi:hypothetical protein
MPGDNVAQWRPALSQRSNFRQLHRSGSRAQRITEYRAKFGGK